MKLEQMEAELGQIIRSPNLQPFMVNWINAAILELATDYELAPLKLVTPEPLDVDTTQWLWPMPTNFHKLLERVEWFDQDGHPRHVRVLHHIDELSGRDHSRIAEHVHEVAVAVQGQTIEGQQNYLGIYPKASQALQLWYYRLPAVVKRPTDSPDCIPPAYVRRVIFPKLVIQNYEFITDQILDFDARPLQYWKQKLDWGLWGTPGGDIGMMNFFAKSYCKPRRHGGKDPIGPGRRWYRGYF
jgi:hypothetical protein